MHKDPLRFTQGKGYVIITNFWSILLDNYWSKKIYRLKMIVWWLLLYSSQMILFTCSSSCLEIFLLIFDFEAVSCGHLHLHGGRLCHQSNGFDLQVFSFQSLLTFYMPSQSAPQEHHWENTNAGSQTGRIHPWPCLQRSCRWDINQPQPIWWSHTLVEKTQLSHGWTNY